MRGIGIIIALFFMHLSGITNAQITLNENNISLQKILKKISKQTGYDVIYSVDDLRDCLPVTINVKNAPLNKVLDICFKEQPLLYAISDKTVMIKRASVEKVLDKAVPGFGELHDVIGRVYDENNKPLGGASVTIESTNLSVTTNYKGEFFFKGVPIRTTLIVSYIGYNSKAHICSGSKDLAHIKLTKTENLIEDVVVNTGMFQRNKETFTGVTNTVSGNDLRMASRKNILEGLNMLDPSFNIVRDNSLGSNPNQLPKVEMRGSRSAPTPVPNTYSQQLKMDYEQDPNQPLFIVDGFESSLQTVLDLDVNMVASVTLLKDAASTALYGSRSANGVVVVETIRPKAGDLRVSYTAAATLAMADLSGYNMMNAEQLLRFQELSSNGIGAPGPFATDKEGTDLLLPQMKHNFRKNAVLNGINSDWMNVPLQNSTALNHSLVVSGGDNFFNYRVGISTVTDKGVMKGSVKENKSGYINLAYRKNKLNIANNLTIQNRNQDAGPYGSFSQYVKVPSYYKINNESKYLEEHHASFLTDAGKLSTKDYYYANPLYNAGLPYRNEVNALTISNNLSVNYDIFQNLRATGGFQYSLAKNTADYFTSPMNTRFESVDPNERGTYDYTSADNQSYRGFLMLTYNKIFNGKHILNANLRSDLNHANNNNLGISAVGFATTAEPLIYLANSYKTDGRPSGTNTKMSSMALIGSANYSYDMRYNLDLSYNLSGTSNFGSDNPYQSFYAMGLGWNIGRENFIKNVSWINHLNLSANFGLTGNQNAGNFGSRNTYILVNDGTYFGEALRLQGVGNPNLDWTKTYNLSYVLAGRFLNNKLSLSMSGYRNLTDPLIITSPLPPSVGIAEGIPKNIGKLTSTGLEVTVDARLKNTKDWTINLGVNAPVLYKSVYSGLGSQLEKFNEVAREGGYLQRYYDGASPDDVWAVRSLGIGQSRGYEVFLDKDGAYTYLFDKNNEVSVGSSRPVTQGNVNARIRYKRFTIAFYTRYVVQEMKFNTALYNKVENISSKQMNDNQDRRAGEVRWLQPGDDASYLGIINGTRGMSSRFLQKENSILIDGVNFNFDFIDQYSQGAKSYLRKKLGLQTLNFGITTSNIFQFTLSNVKIERGLDYPFQRSATLNMNLTF